MKSIELFTGAGGLALGISKAGFSHKAVIEWDRYACETIMENQARGTRFVKDWPLLPMDVRHMDYDNIQERVDLVAGGPPCQPFSLGGKHRGQDDNRNMFPEAVRAVRELRPKAFIFENVKGLTREAFSTYFNYIYLSLCYPEIRCGNSEPWQDHLSRLEEHHTSGKQAGLFYRVITRVRNAADYGVPQRRERVFFVGFRCDISEEWSFPEETHSEDALLHDQWVTGEYWDRHAVSRRKRTEMPACCAKRVKGLRFSGSQRKKPWVTVRDAICDLPDPAETDRCAIPNHRLVPGARIYPGHTGSALDQPAKTLKAGDHGVPGGENVVVFPDGSLRYFTIREAARLQTFPDDYLFHGSWTESMRQIGNAVPVELAFPIASSVLACIRRANDGRKDQRGK